MENMTVYMNNAVVSDVGISGTFYVTIGDAAFPEDGWYDLISVDLEHWIPSLTSFAMNHTDFCELQFMDGPFRIRLTRDTDGVFVSCLRNQKQFVHELIDLNAFLFSVTKCIGQYHWISQTTKFRKELQLLKECIDIGENHV